MRTCDLEAGCQEARRRVRSACTSARSAPSPRARVVCGDRTGITDTGIRAAVAKIGTLCLPSHGPPGIAALFGVGQLNRAHRRPNLMKRVMRCNVLDMRVAQMPMRQAVMRPRAIRLDSVSLSRRPPTARLLPRCTEMPAVG